MTKRLSIASAVLTLLSALMALLLLSAPAFAHHKADHDKGKGRASSSDKGDRDGDADSEQGTTTEKDDGDPRDATDPNEDDGDNAHPSGKDRSVENGSSKSNPNQGKSESDPDDDGRGPDRSNGGADKPGGTGGVDVDDQDGNNGCGNDDDFEDDNEGWCGKPPLEDTVAPDVSEVPEVPEVPETVLGDLIENDEVDDKVLAGTITAEADDEVAAAATRPTSRGAALPFTGANLVLFLIAALGLLGAGAALLRTRRS